ncbi:hypothetical protein KCP73_12200 [Salmonella enterica subsp. enterica]|nr:hypothetical protein KCP73_12200 [Salmonella enterica subsp. enterica]
MIEFARSLSLLKRRLSLAKEVVGFGIHLFQSILPKAIHKLTAGKMFSAMVNCGIRFSSR